MSAYICNPEHIAALAAFAANHGCLIYEWQTAAKAAAGLMRENIRSVNHRYSENDMQEDDVQEAMEYARRYQLRPHPLRPIDILAMCNCLDYQSCETDDWNDTMAHRQIDWIKGAAERMLPGWDSAIRDFTDQSTTERAA